jgi:hypothetical protein
MFIDRHNYEECFILYWDDELTVSQKQAVENFVKENSDLQEEFRLLGETRFTPDHNILFEEKEFLLNNSFINITNYEDQLLNYIDDEVTPAQRKEVEKFVAQYPAVKQELALLQKAKLQPEAEVVFPDKSILYRKEEKVRVISMTWFRVAVAAAILLIAGFTTFKLINTNKKDINSVAVTTKPVNSNPLNNQKDTQATSNKQPDVVNVNEKAVPGQTTEKKETQKPENKIENTIASNKPENKNNLPKEGNKNNQTTKEQNTIPDETIAYNFSKDNSKADKFESGNSNDLFSSTSVTNPTRFTSDIIVDKPPTKEGGEGGGIKEFLRKTTRVFERRTRIQTTTDDNKLLVGAFAVSLK